MTEPVIGVIDLGNDLFRRYMKGKYLQALRAAGAQPVLLPWARTAEEAGAALSGCSGLLLPGGADADPALYGETRQKACGKPCPGRDLAEPLYYACAKQRGIPVLGICRGFQMLNIMNGGTLWQDIGQMEGRHVRHMDFFGRAKPCAHTVTVAGGTRLAACLPKAVPVQGVNSMHHQILRTAGSGFVISAVSEDGVPEAVELPGEWFCMGVQWHPEHLAAKDAFAQNLFAAFTAAAADR